MEVPIFIKSEIAQQPQRIPKTIIQTFHTNKIHEELYNNIELMRKLNPEYDYRLITDEEGIELMKQNFSPRVLSAFQQLKLGAAKGDFIRYIALFLFGGVYVDLDASIQLDLNTLISPNNEFVFFINGDINLEQFCFMIRPKHEIMLKIIEEMVIRIENKEGNIFKATGPTLFNDVVYNMMNNTSIYDTNTNVSSDDRAICYSNNNSFMGGRLLLRYGEIENQIIFRIKDSEFMLYDNIETFRYCTYDPSTNINYVQSLF